MSPSICGTGKPFCFAGQYISLMSLALQLFPVQLCASQGVSPRDRLPYDIWNLCMETRTFIEYDKSQCAERYHDMLQGIKENLESGYDDSDVREELFPDVRPSPFVNVVGA